VSVRDRVHGRGHGRVSVGHAPLRHDCRENGPVTVNWYMNSSKGRPF